MQINSGKATILAATPNTVTGNIDADWSQVLQNNLFCLNGQSFRINSCNPTTKTITLDGSFITATDLVNVDYVIVRDFSANHALPLLNSGDLEAATLFTRAMQIIDSRLGTSGSTDASISITKAAHGFKIGNMLRFNGTTWVLADASVALPNALVVGAVSEIVDVNTFKLVTQGRVAGVQGISLTPGTVYYVRLSPSSGVNIVDNSAGAWTFVGDVRVPVLIADSTSSGYLLGLATATSGTFSTSGPGLVPVSPGGTTNFLRADGAWAAGGLANDSINVQHLNRSNTTINWTGFETGTSGLSVHRHIVDLNNRITGVANSAVLVPYEESFNALGGSFIVPAGVYKMAVELNWGVGFESVSYNVMTGSRSTTTTTAQGIRLRPAIRTNFVIAVTPGQLIELVTSVGATDGGGAYGLLTYAPTTGQVATYYNGAYYNGLKFVFKVAGTEVAKLGPDAAFVYNWDYAVIEGQIVFLSPKANMLTLGVQALSAKTYYCCSIANYTVSYALSSAITHDSALATTAQKLGAAPAPYFPGATQVTSSQPPMGAGRASCLLRWLSV